MRVAAVQMRAGDNKTHNVERAIHLIEAATRQGARLVVLPETWSFMGTSKAIAENAESIPGPITDRLADVARRLGIYLHAGSIHERADGEPRSFNTSVVFDPDGDIIASYRKIHLYDVSIGDDVLSMESAAIAPGDEVVTVELPEARIGLTICYDLRYPELYRLLALDGAEVIVVPAAFHQHTGRDHWEVLLRARAIENQVFIVAANAHGAHPNGWLSFGRSMIVDPWGTVLATAPDGEGVVVADCDFDRLTAIREQLPSLENRRPHAYQWVRDDALV